MRLERLLAANCLGVLCCRGLNRDAQRASAGAVRLRGEESGPGNPRFSIERFSSVFLRECLRVSFLPVSICEWTLCASIGLRCRWLEQPAYEAAYEFESAAVDDVSSPVLEVIDGVGLDGRRRQAESRNGDNVGTQEEQGSESGSSASRHFGQNLGGDSVDDAHEGTEGVVDGLTGFLLLFGVEGFAGGFGDFAGENFGGILLPRGLLFFFLLLALYFLRGLTLRELDLLFSRFSGGCGELHELVHGYRGGDPCRDSGKDSSGNGRSFSAHRNPPVLSLILDAIFAVCFSGCGCQASNDRSR